jgi:uncharacterized membrane protein
MVKVASWVVVSLSAVMMGEGAARAQAPRFRVSRIINGSDSGDSSRINAMRDDGWAVGAGTSGALVWDLTGPKPLPGPAGAPIGEAVDINSKGQIAGWVAPTSGPARVAIWENSQIKQVLPVPLGYEYALGQAINERGDVVAGAQRGSDGANRILFWHDGLSELIGPDWARPTGINAKRQISGCTRTEPLVWENGATRILPPASTGAAGCAYAINEAGASVGESGFKAMLWQNGTGVILTPPEMKGIGLKINNRGDAFGWIYSPGYEDYMFYRPGAGGGLWPLDSLVDLPEGFHGPIYASDLNNQGHLLAMVQGPGGAYRHVDLEPYVPAGADNQPPKITLTSPATGSYLTDVAVLQATATDNVAVAGVQFFVDGAPVGAEDTTAPYSVEVSLMAYGNNRAIGFWAVARDTSSNRAVTNIKSMIVQNACFSLSQGGSRYGWIGTQTGTFTVRWSGALHPEAVGPIEGGFALALGKPLDFPGTSTTVLFAPDGLLKARNGTAYPGGGLPYDAAWSTQNFLRFRMVVDVPSNRYSVWVRRLNEPEKQLASGFAFRKAVTSLDNWMMHVDDGSDAFQGMRVCNVTVKPGS